MERVNILQDILFMSGNAVPSVVIAVGSFFFFLFSVFFSVLFVAYCQTAELNKEKMIYNSPVVFFLFRSCLIEARSVCA